MIDLLVMAGVLVALHTATPPPPQHVCPAPRSIIMVRCPGPHEITTMTVSCKVKRKIDDCATRVHGGRT